MSNKPGVIFLFDGTQLTIPCEAKYVSDGAHCFDDLYRFRCLLFCHLCHAYPLMAWRSRRHSDGSQRDGQFIAGLRTPTGDVNIHMPMAEYWHLLDGIEEKRSAPSYDGSSSREQMDRLNSWLSPGYINATRDRKRY